MAFYQLYKPVKVIVPMKDIPVGEIITQQDLAQMTISRRDMHSDTVTLAGSAIGKYAKDNLYEKEPILNRKLSEDDSEVKIAPPADIASDETYISFKPNEAKWPSGLSKGNTVSIIGISEYGPTILVEKVRVLSSAGSQTSGQIDNLKSVVGANDGSITLALKWEQVGPFFNGRVLSKELWLVPEHPDKRADTSIYPIKVVEDEEVS